MQFILIESGINSSFVLKTRQIKTRWCKFKTDKKQKLGLESNMTDRKQHQNTVNAVLFIPSGFKNKSISQSINLSIYQSIKATLQQQHKK